MIQYFMDLHPSVYSAFFTACFGLWFRKQTGKILSWKDWVLSLVLLFIFGWLGFMVLEGHFENVWEQVFWASCAAFTFSEFMAVVIISGQKIIPKAMSQKAGVKIKDDDEVKQK